ncbi:hypothetical protein M3_0163 [Lysinibacillus phage vB_LfM_LysYB1]|nr:hypothetical protein M3_0163 [Lysinibacillus phage vB_LfM_LysYB1]WAB25326.1 hypothetical protein M5_0148 [Lysinibacillus phage vB_LfM_LysYB2]
MDAYQMWKCGICQEEYMTKGRAEECCDPECDDEMEEETE